MLFSFIGIFRLFISTKVETDELENKFRFLLISCKDALSIGSPASIMSFTIWTFSGVVSSPAAVKALIVLCIAAVFSNRGIMVTALELKPFTANCSDWPSLRSIPSCSLADISLPYTFIFTSFPSGVSFTDTTVPWMTAPFFRFKASPCPCGTWRLLPFRTIGWFDCDTLEIPLIRNYL